MSPARAGLAAEICGKYGEPKKMKGRVGEGGAKFKFNAVNGSIKVYRADSTT